MGIQESFPFNDPIMVLKVSGKILKEALELGVKNYPAEDGAFLQVSNIEFMFDKTGPKGNRIDPNDIVTCGGGDFHLQNYYTVAMPKFMAIGGDGFKMFLREEVETIVDEENGLGMIDVVKQFFKRTRTDFQVNIKRELGRQIRFRLFNVDQEDEEDGMSPDGQYWKVGPTKTGRILWKGEQIPEDYARMKSHINM